MIIIMYTGESLVNTKLNQNNLNFYFAYVLSNKT